MFRESVDRRRRAAAADQGCHRARRGPAGFQDRLESGKALCTGRVHHRHKAVEEGQEDPIIKKFTLRFLDNKAIDKEEKQKNIERWSALGEDELRMRAEGEFTTGSTLMYPTFNLAIHVLGRDKLDKIPHDWTRYVSIDPGHAVMATLFAAIPPDNSMILLYDELYIRNCNAAIWGKRFKEKVGHQHIYAMIMDMHGGTLRDIGSGRLPHELYSEELKKHDTVSYTHLRAHET